MLKKELLAEVRKQGKLTSFNPFKDIELMNYNEKHQTKQKALMEKYTKEIQEGNRYLQNITNINDEEGLKRAYNGETEDSLYYHPQNRPLYIAGTKDIPRDVIDDLFIPFKMVHLSKRYGPADSYIKRHRDKIETVVGHSLGSAVAMRLNEDEGNPGRAARHPGHPGRAVGHPGHPGRAPGHRGRAAGHPAHLGRPSWPWSTPSRPYSNPSRPSRPSL